MPRMTRVRGKGQVTIPADVREAVHLEEGDLVEVDVTDDGILLRPRKVVDAAQAWFWTSEWQAREREASQEARAGRGERFSSGEELLRALGARSKRSGHGKRHGDV